MSHSNTKQISNTSISVGADRLKTKATAATTEAVTATEKEAEIGNNFVSVLTSVSEIWSHFSTKSRLSILQVCKALNNKFKSEVKPIQTELGALLDHCRENEAYDIEKLQMCAKQIQNLRINFELFEDIEGEILESTCTPESERLCTYLPYFSHVTSIELCFVRQSDHFLVARYLNLIDQHCVNIQRLAIYDFDTYEPIIVDTNTTLFRERLHSLTLRSKWQIIDSSGATPCMRNLRRFESFHVSKNDDMCSLPNLKNLKLIGETPFNQAFYNVLPQLRKARFALYCDFRLFAIDDQQHFDTLEQLHLEFLPTDRVRKGGYYIAPGKLKVLKISGVVGKISQFPIRFNFSCQLTTLIVNATDLAVQFLALLVRNDDIHLQRLQNLSLKLYLYRNENKQYLDTVHVAKHLPSLKRFYVGIRDFQLKHFDCSGEEWKKLCKDSDGYHYCTARLTLRITQLPVTMEYLLVLSDNILIHTIAFPQSLQHIYLCGETLASAFPTVISAIGATLRPQGAIAQALSLTKEKKHIIAQFAIDQTARGRKRLISDVTNANVQ